MPQEQIKSYLAANLCMEAEFLNYNGKIYPADKLLISPNNRSFRYGDGFFETMKMINGKIILCDLHFQRLFSSLETMRFSAPSAFTATILEQQIIELAQKNKHTGLARVRLMVFRGDGGLHDEDNTPNYLIQTWERDASCNTLNVDGLVTGIYRDAKKTCDKFSSIKHNNYLCYTMAALWAKQNGLSDAIVLNAYDRIAEASIANLFIVKDGILKTPALTEGCISGVVRKYLLECCKNDGIPVEETEITEEDIQQASEIFLTNTGFGIRWVKSCGQNNYTLQTAAVLHKKFIDPLYT